MFWKTNLNNILKCIQRKENNVFREKKTKQNSQELELQFSGKDLPWHV